jgi:hypothetical protein
VSIIDPKYKGRPAKADWLTDFVEKNATTAIVKTVKSKAEDGTETSETVETGKRATDLDKLFALAEANGFPAHAKYGDQVDRKNAVGRLRMTIGNVLRAAARKRGGLYNVDKDFIDADDAFMAGGAPTHNPDGTKIVKATVATKEAETA